MTGSYFILLFCTYLMSVFGGNENSMSMSESNPVRMELKNNPGTSLGRIEDFDLDKIRRGDFLQLPTWARAQQASFQNPLENLYRKQRSDDGKACEIAVQETVMKPGNCVNLGGSVPACKANGILRISHPECI